MLVGLFFCIIIILSVELFSMGMVVGFFQKKIVIKDIGGFVIVALTLTFFLVLGHKLGVFSSKIFPDYSLWYAATVIFILGLKMFYDGLKLRNLKQLINPLEIKGLLVLTILAGLNVFFVGLGFGLMHLPSNFVFFTVFIFLAVILIGYFMGFRSEKLFSRKFEFLSGIFYIIIAIIIAANR